MNKNLSDKKTGFIPLEKHETAAWANIEGVKPVSNVTIPSEFDVDEAKKWVEVNKK